MATYQEKLVGVTRDGRQAVIAQLRAGNPVIVMRDRANQYDLNAIEVKAADGRSLGYIARERAAQLAPQLDRLGGSVPGRVMTIMGGGPNLNYGVIVEFSVAEPAPAAPEKPMRAENAGAESRAAASTAAVGWASLQADAAKPSARLSELLPHLIRYDPSLSRDAKRLQAYLNDLAAQEPKLWIRGLVEVCTAGAVDRLEIEGIPVPARAKAMLTRVLFDSRGLRPDVAEWAVEMWSVALEFKVRPLPKEPDYPWHVAIDDRTLPSDVVTVSNGDETSVAEDPPSDSLIWDDTAPSSDPSDGSDSHSEDAAVWDDLGTDAVNDQGGEARNEMAAPGGAADGVQAANNELGEDLTALLAEHLALSRTTAFERDQLVFGRIISIAEYEILIEITAKHEGVVKQRDIEALVSHPASAAPTHSEGIVKRRDIQLLPTDVRNALKVGDEVYAYVIDPEDSNGNILLSLSRAVAEKDWQYAEELLDRKEPFEATIAGFNKGGVIIHVGRLRGFVPASQLSISHMRMLGEATLPPEQRFQNLVGQKAYIKVVEIDRDRNRLILSERAAAKEVRKHLKETLLASIEPGQVLEGIVTSIKDFGAFVDLGGADGLIHISELSHTRVKHPGEVLEEGQKVEVKVLSIDRAAGRIVLSRKALQADPWPLIGSQYRAGQLVQAEVIKLHKKFGALVRLRSDAIEGSISPSGLAEPDVTAPREIVKAGQVVDAWILSIDAEARRIELSLRRVADSSAVAETQSSASPELDEYGT